MSRSGSLFLAKEKFSVEERKEVTGRKQIDRISVHPKDFKWLTDSLFYEERER